MRDRAGQNLRCHEPGDVCHVHHQQTADRVGDVRDAFVVDKSGVGAAPGDNQLRPMLPSQFLEFVVVDELRLLVQAIGDKPVKFAHEIGGGTVGEVPTVIEPHTKSWRSSSGTTPAAKKTWPLHS